MRYAFINDYVIKKIEDCDSAEAESQLNYYQTVICIDGISPEPQVGWTWDGRERLYLKLSPLTPRQIRMALILNGITLDNISDSFALLEEPLKSLAIIQWEYAIEFLRDDPLVNQVGVALGWSPEQIDQLWMFAHTL